jgi:adenosylcobinamide-GDP ribazoletransferase
MCSNGKSTFDFSAPRNPAHMHTDQSEPTTNQSQGQVLGGPKLGLARYFAAQQLLTRLPCPSWTVWQARDLAASTKWFPMVGLLVGGIAAAIVALFGGVFGYSGLLVAFVGIAVAPIVTGGFHEDAFADVCDAFGAMNPTRRREIMRDSVIGSFGAAGLVLLLVGKFAALSTQSWQVIIPLVVCAHVVSRWTSVLVIRITTYVEDPDSLAKPYAGTVTNARLLFASIMPTTPALLFVFGLGTGAAIGMGLVVLCALSAWFFRRWVGGITGDCLGAVNQLAELLVYVVAAQPSVAQTLADHFG